LCSSAGFHGACGSSNFGSARSGLPPPPAPPSSTDSSPAVLSYTGRRGKPLPPGFFLPPMPLPSSFPLSSSSLAVDRGKIPKAVADKKMRMGLDLKGQPARVCGVEGWTVEGDFRWRGAHLRCPRGRAAAMGAGAACVAPCPTAPSRGTLGGEKVGERRG
jgi:hypothetical protein